MVRGFKGGRRRLWGIQTENSFRYGRFRAWIASLFVRPLGIPPSLVGRTRLPARSFPTLWFCKGLLLKQRAGLDALRGPFQPV